MLLGGCTADVDRGDPIPLQATGESLGELRQQAQKTLTRYATSPVASASADGSSPGISIDTVTGAKTGNHLSVTFTGVSGPATEPCGADYYAEAVESDRAVVVIVVAQHHAANEICPMIGFTRTAELNLAKPLGDRAVLEASHGTQIPLT